MRLQSNSFKRFAYGTYKVWIAAVVALVFMLGGSGDLCAQYKMRYPEPIADTENHQGVPLGECPVGYYNLTKDGKFVLQIPYQFEDGHMFSNITDHAIAKKEGLWGLINVDGSTFVPFIYDGIDGPNLAGYYKIMRDGKCGLMDKSGMVTVDCKYDHMSDLGNGWYDVCVDGNWGYVHRSGVFAPTYSEYQEKKEYLGE